MYNCMHMYLSTIIPANKLKIRCRNTYVLLYVPFFLQSLNVVTLSPVTFNPNF